MSELYDPVSNKDLPKVMEALMRWFVQQRISPDDGIFVLASLVGSLVLREPKSKREQVLMELFENIKQAMNDYDR